MLKERIYELIEKVRSFIRSSAKYKDYIPFRWIISYKEHIAIVLYIMWMAGCGYWGYHLLAADAKPNPGWIFVVTDSREALVFLIFGIIGLLFVFALTLLFMKFIYNLFLEVIDSLFPMQWHSLVKSLSYLTILCIAFLLTSDIKMVGVTARQQFSDLVHTSEQRNTENKIKTGRLMEFIEKRIDRIYE